MRSKRVKTSTGDAAPAHAAVAITDSSAPYLCREKERAHASADPGKINLSTHLHLSLSLARALCRGTADEADEGDLRLSAGGGHLNPKPYTLNLHGPAPFGRRRDSRDDTLELVYVGQILSCSGRAEQTPIPACTCAWVLCLLVCACVCAFACSEYLHHTHTPRIHACAYRYRYAHTYSPSASEGAGVLALPNPDKRTKRSDFKGDATATTQILKSQCINVYTIES